MPQRQIQTKKTAVKKETFRRTDRFRRRSEYLHIQRFGQRVHTTHFIVLVLATENGTRLGVTVTKKVSHAVGRNRIKRLVREVFRRNRFLFPDNSQIVMIARPGAERLSYMLVKAEMEKARIALVRASKMSLVYSN